jgi:hypothetical protein
VRVVGRQHQVRGALAILQLERGQLVLLVLFVRLLLSILLLLDRLEQLLFFLPDELLAVAQRGSVFFAALSVSCCRPGPLPSSGTRNRLPSRT